MNQLISKLLVLPLCIASFHGLTPAAAEEKATSKPKFVPMFDGKTLDGWSVIPEKAQKAWATENGKIVGDGDKGRSYLQYDKNKEISDFEMKFSYRFPKRHGNSGVNCRAIKDVTGKRSFQSYHVDIGHVGIGDDVLGAWDFHTPGRKEHGCPRGKRLLIDENDKATYSDLDGAISVNEIKKGDWNKVHVLVKGDQLKFSINGKPSAEFTEKLSDDKKLHKGAIQLQLHDPGMIVEFKDLQLKVLK